MGKLTAIDGTPLRGIELGKKRLELALEKREKLRAQRARPEKTERPRRERRTTKEE